MIIGAWYNHRNKHSFFDYKPNMFFAIAEEMSEKTIPFLLFNLAIRGINANVIQCNSLTRDCQEIYLIYNEKDDSLSFSEIYKMPKDKRLEEMFQVKFI